MKSHFLQTRHLPTKLGTALGLLLAASIFVSPFSQVERIATAQTPNSSAQSSNTSLDPSFEVATIKSSNPDERQWGLGTRGNHFWAQNTTMVDLISFAYEVHAKQIVGGPPWCRTEKFDIEGVPNFEGRPIKAQLQTVLRKLLADRFHLQTHTEKRQLEIFSLVAATDGVKFHKSGDVPSDARSGYTFLDIVPVTQMKVMRMTMPAFASVLQRTVLDRPVVDETGLQDRYDFEMQWTPDETQFTQFRGTGVVVLLKALRGTPPPGLFTAIQNQLGLKLEAKKAMAEVIVIDHLDEPSAN